uniref:carbamoyl-phosphate synthase large subunit n=1 Tax=Blastomonas sp. TaxID=1909299 RepID=UPI0035945A81
PRDDIIAALSQATPDRLLIAAQAMREGLTIDEVHAISKYDLWFLEQIEGIVDAEAEVMADGLPRDADGMRRLKSMGFSDKRLAWLALQSAHLRPGMDRALARGSGMVRDAVVAMAGALTEDEVRALRHKLGVRPVFKRIDTCAAEFEARTPYMYSTYEAPSFGEPECESQPTDKRKVVILGGGPNRIGQGIEFDYCCCHACFALGSDQGGAGFETIMINCNPETVSTDYDTSDRLYFEPLTTEDVLEILHAEQANGELYGVIVQFGGQTPLKLAQALEDAGIPILGTSPDAIDLAEDRERFARLVDQLGLKQPLNGIARSREEAIAVANRIGYPVLIRPSYVLGGRAMEIVDGQAQLESYIATAVQVSGDSPVLIDQYLRDAIEVDVDAICDGRDVAVAGVMQHIEEAGVHSGDSACSLPPYSLDDSLIAEMERQTGLLAMGLKVRGLMNIQFAVKDGEIYLIEVNPRASRTVPFVAKAIGQPVAKYAARVMAGEMLSDLPAIRRDINYVAVKEAVFPWARFAGVDPVLSPEMKSTGEVMGIANDFATAFAKAQIGAGLTLPTKGTVFISVKNSDKPAMIDAARGLIALGMDIVATGGTASYLTEHGIPLTEVNKVAQGRPHIVDKIKDGDIALIFNTTEGWQSLKDSQSIRASALTGKIPYFTTAAASVATVKAMASLAKTSLEVKPLQAYYKRLDA